MVSEDELKERAVAPRVTLESIQAEIEYKYCFTAAQGARGLASPSDNYVFEGSLNSLERLTFCVLVLKNGFTVVGQSACVSPANYQKDIGQRIAYDNAISKIWSLKGYELCTFLMNQRDWDNQ